ncbi:MAG: 4-(cytidine 5'-diphospho)-2-C-methyl-D-erythritol kinase [Lachnospiraceae bacterium]|nr:4-(cytidine 5'-diphospho)-2-C-methyl-D-erythritol kinase [Lachnospiraceae bacterium]
MTGPVRETAYAKINLALDVTGRRPDGYHEVRMVMQTIDIRDSLEFAVDEGTDGIRIQGSGKLPGGQELSLGPDNLIWRAAQRIREQCGIGSGVRIRLVKQIPIAAGMAGGSADAAATLRGMNRLFECGLTDTQLREMGKELGADIPYCIGGGTQLAEGIGEKLTLLPEIPELILAVAKPATGVSTRYVYETLDTIAGWKGEAPAGMLIHPDVDAMVRAIREGDRAQIPSLLGNVLEAVTVPACPEVGWIKALFASGGARGVLMSGSGPTVFGIFETEEDAERAVSLVRSKELASREESFVTWTVTPDLPLSS